MGACARQPARVASDAGRRPPAAPLARRRARGPLSTQSHPLAARRAPQGSVWGSGSAGAACAALALLTGNYALWQVGFVASFTSKLSDTVSSEIGKVGAGLLV